MTTYAVVFHVSSTNLDTVIAVVKSTAKLISVLPVEEEKSEPEKPDRNFHYAGGKRNKGISGEDLALQVIEKAGRPVSNDELKQAFLERGFAGNSYSAPISYLVKKGKVVSAGSGKWGLKGSVIHLGATSK